MKLEKAANKYKYSQRWGGRFTGIDSTQDEDLYPMKKSDKEATREHIIAAWNYQQFKRFPSKLIMTILNESPPPYLFKKGETVSKTKEGKLIKKNDNAKFQGTVDEVKNDGTMIVNFNGEKETHKNVYNEAFILVERADKSYEWVNDANTNNLVQRARLLRTNDNSIIDDLKRKDNKDQKIIIWEHIIQDKTIHIEYSTKTPIIDDSIPQYLIFDTDTSKVIRNKIPNEITSSPIVCRTKGETYQIQTKYNRNKYNLYIHKKSLNHPILIFAQQQDKPNSDKRFVLDILPEFRVFLRHLSFYYPKEYQYIWIEDNIVIYFDTTRVVNVVPENTFILNSGNVLPSTLQNVYVAFGSSTKIYFMIYGRINNETHQIVVQNSELSCNGIVPQLFNQKYYDLFT